MEILAGQCGSARTPDDSPHTPDDFPKSSKVGAFLPRPPPFCEKTSVSGHQKSRKGTNPIRPNDAIPSFSPSEGAFFSIQPHILTPYSSIHAKRTTQASYQNLGGYMCLHLYNDTSYDCRSDRFRVSRGVHLHPCAHLLAISPNLKHRILTAFIHPAISSLRCAG